MQRFFYIDNFRAIAIIYIVLGHCINFLYIPDSQNLDLYQKFLSNILQGGTFFFVFITGYLTPKIFYEKYNFSRFYKKKSLQTIPPYLILSTPIIIFYYIKNVSLFKDNEWYVQLLGYTLTGNTFYAYWYIPFIMLLFLLYPLLVKAQKNSKTLILLIIILGMSSLYIQRPVDHINVIQSVIYYIPVYLLGSFVMKKEEYFIKNSNIFIPLSFILFLVFIYLQIRSGHLGNYHSYFFQYNGIDYMFLQKFCLTIFTFLLLLKYFNRRFNILMKFSKNSFGIFFTHMPVLYIIAAIDRRFPLEPSILSYLLIFIMTTVLSVISIKVTKSIFKEKSKYLIGV